MAMNKGLTFRMGQTHVRRWTDDLTRRIDEGQIDPSFVITHTAKLEEGPGMYRVVRAEAGQLHQGRAEAVRRAQTIGERTMNELSTLVTSRPDRSLTTTDRVARGLGWFSLGLGLAEIVAPGKLGRALGLEGRETLLRAYGGREIGAGIWALSDTPAPAIWARFAGDLVDLGTLAAGLRGADEAQRRNAFIALAAVGGITLVDLLTALSLTAEQERERARPAATIATGAASRAAPTRRAARPRARDAPVDFQVSATEERTGEALEPA